MNIDDINNMIKHNGIELDNSISTRLYIDYKNTTELVDSMGEDGFIDFINGCMVVTMDRESYKFITELKEANKI